MKKYAMRFIGPVVAILVFLLITGDYRSWTQASMAIPAEVPSDLSFEGTTTIGATQTNISIDGADNKVLYLGGKITFLEVNLVNAAAGAALTNFKVVTYSHPNAEAFEVLAGADYVNAIGDTLRRCSNTVPNTLALSGTSTFKLHVAGIYALSFAATGENAVVTIRGTGCAH